MTEVILPPFKFCTKCGAEYPRNTEFFQRCAKSADGLSWRCKSCLNEINAQYRDANREKVRAIGRKHYYANQAARIEYAKKWNKSHPHRRKQIEANRNPVDIRVKRIISGRREARRKSLPDTLTKHEWIRALEYFNGCCAACGRPEGLWHRIVADHWIPLSKGGGTVVENIVPLCHATPGGSNCCNTNKKDRDALEWLISDFGNKKAKEILRRVEQYFAWAKSQC